MADGGKPKIDVSGGVRVPADSRLREREKGDGCTASAGPPLGPSILSVTHITGHTESLYPTARFSVPPGIARGRNSERSVPSALDEGSCPVMQEFLVLLM